MNRPTAWNRAFLATSALCLVAAPYLHSQTAPAPAKEDDTIVLSPFVVEASEDAGKYSATSTLAGTRVRTDLKDVASSISVVTQQFLQDTGSHNAQDLLVYTPNTEVGGLRGNYSGQGGNVIYNEPLVNPNNNTRVRGLDAADNTRDYFLTDIPFDTFNVGRIDLQRGPNSILFGVGSPAGIINASVNTAGFKNAFNYQNVTSSFGSQRNSLDANFVLAPNELAIRVAAVNDKQKFQQQPAFNNTTRFYGALRFDPKIINVADSHTSIRANYENGSVKSNNPRQTPPEDQITPWFNRGVGLDGVTPAVKPIINEFVPGQGAGSVYSKTNFPNFAEGRAYWQTPINYFNGSPSGKPGTNPPVLSGIPTNIIVAENTTGWAIDATGKMAPPNQPGNGSNIGIGGLPNFQPLAVAPFGHYAKANLKGGTYYADQVLTDSSVFDFYNNLLDGPNAREWQNWNAFNLAASQTFFNERLGFELVYDQQEYSSGQVGALGGENYGINIDVNKTLTDGTPNDNVGRPYVAGGAEGGNFSQKTQRNSTRLTANGDLRAEDYLGKTTLAKIIGRHTFTGLLGLDHKNQNSLSWSQYAAGPDWETQNNYDLSVKIANYRLFNWTDYLGPTLAGATSAHNAHVTNIQNVIAPAASSSVKYFDSHWAHSLLPGSPGYIDPAAPYQYFNSDTGVLVNSTQSNNPANYGGWKTESVTWLNANNPKDFPSLVTGGTKTQFRDLSQALIWQGYLLDGDLALTYGWRKDKIVNYQTNSPIDPATSLASIDYGRDGTSRRTIEGQTRTWGGVYHVPKFIMDHVPGGTTLSFSYDNSRNFKADAPRTNFAGQQIPNPDGITKEYGVTITTLNDKLAFKATHYETTVHFATLQNDSLAGLGGNGYLLDLIPAWGYGYAANVQYGLDGKYGNITTAGQGNEWNYAVSDIKARAQGATDAEVAAVGTPQAAATTPIATYGYGGTGPVTETDIVNAWLKMPVPDGFFDFFGITGNRPNPAKARVNGKLYEGFNGPFPGGVGGQQPSGSISTVSTVDNISKGWEYELTAQPTKNWNITMNYSKTQATKTNIDPITKKFMADNLAFYQGPGGQLRLWGASQTAGYGTATNTAVAPEVYPYTPGQSNGSTVGPQWIAGVYNPYLVTALAQGQSTPEVAPWRFNLVTSYNFDQGPVKGFFTGGGYRMEAGRILGYGLDKTTYVVDVNQVLTGPTDHHYDLWIGYNKKFTYNRKINWRIQLNLRDVGEASHLVAARYQPDGTLALARIQQGMTWQLTNSFDF
jgi:outer membrane receptor protein involved in Fe transport